MQQIRILTTKQNPNTFGNPFRDTTVGNIYDVVPAAKGETVECYCGPVPILEDSIIFTDDSGDVVDAFVRNAGYNFESVY